MSLIDREIKIRIKLKEIERKGRNEFIKGFDPKKMKLIRFNLMHSVIHFILFFISIFSYLEFNYFIINNYSVHPVDSYLFSYVMFLFLSIFLTQNPYIIKNYKVKSFLTLNKYVFGFFSGCSFVFVIAYLIDVIPAFIFYKKYKANRKKVIKSNDFKGSLYYNKEIKKLEKQSKLNMEKIYNCEFELDSLNNFKTDKKEELICLKQIVIETKNRCDFSEFVELRKKKITNNKTKIKTY